ncbi:MAG: hypothetical protein GY869_25475, partial [Planctomycetes bacterium]|nr:hypothetical protein [Planctomycetota bacterium]
MKKCLLIAIFIVSMLCVPLWAQDMTLQRAAPAAAGMSAAILQEGVRMFEKGIEDGQLQEVVLLV